ncbi:replication restart helicase PriA [Lachnoclostridium phytofermentans]|uniref:Replication restart protein PriA n=1 Tax=Lachnoclostridium phytofermentans (strain ATCC 700394 / DSM 18823 / ISDg) TaxID=357809 RepID=A9KMA0_LACP7|nr:primosomal protein N' [Lachnoclostridium phytofermentans]ABX42854.1 primosomal protein N' [Lachnoclostridium phytofermentans ISDg]
MQYADIIVDISVENLDKTYQYSIPPALCADAVIGVPVTIPFGNGNRSISGFIVGLSDVPKIAPERIKSILGIKDKGLPIEGQMIALAAFVKEQYGGTMNDALKTVIPVKKSVKQIEKRIVSSAVSKEKLQDAYIEAEKKKHKAKARLLLALMNSEEIEFEDIVNKLNISRTTINSLKESGIIQIESETKYRNPIASKTTDSYSISLNYEQQEIVSKVLKDYEEGIRKTYLIHGITGSGKTEVYMGIIDQVIQSGRQVIMLIPEIALTYQTVVRFYKRFGNRISILNSKMSAGERYDQIERAKNGDIDIMIGPRSALFTPFKDLGLIIIDEEHETSYKSEMPPKYHAREVAIKRGELSNASIILGSATPSLEAYKKAMDGEFELFHLTKRAKEAKVPMVSIVDLKEELKKKNKSIFSDLLRSLIEDRLRKKEQIMLFLNRRGYAGFVSCRSCGTAMKCPHCDISLTAHSTGVLKCHYCGYEIPTPNICPVCGSKYIAAFGTGTQKVEAMVLKEFPTARVLRMDADTTKNKLSYEEILSSFANGEADILIGTQMIVKGHDFAGVTLVGILAADLSLYANDYRAAERTFQLLAQAAGRAGRGELIGEVVIQTYQPEHYAVTTAATEDYVAFYEQEMNYRRLMKYPPAAHIMAILIQSKEEEVVILAADLLAGAVKEWLKAKVELINQDKPDEQNKFIEQGKFEFKEQDKFKEQGKIENYLENNEQDDNKPNISIIGPAPAGIAKMNDIYRRVLYLKEEQYEYLVEVKDFLEQYITVSEYFKKCNVQFDFDPMNSY